MKTVIAKHKSTGNLHEVEIYSTFVYFVNEYRQISITDFNEYFTINN